MKKFSSKYKAEKKLGSGHSGDIYLCRESDASACLAVRLLPSEIAGNAAFVKCMKSLMQFRNPFIARVKALEVADNDPSHYLLISEYVDGVTLREFLKQQKNNTVALEQLPNIIIPVAQALDYAHKYGIWHGNLSLNNVIVSDNELKVTDFSLKHYLRRLPVKQSGYLPESQCRVIRLVAVPVHQLAELHSNYFIQDKYALSLIAYELLTGRELPAENPGNVLDLSQIRAGTVRQVFQKALHQDPELRFDDCGKFAAALNHAVQAAQLDSTVKSNATSESTEIAEEQVSEMPATPRSQSSGGKKIFMLVVLAGIIAGGVAYFNAPEKEKSEDVPVAEQVNAEKAPETLAPRSTVPPATEPEVPSTPAAEEKAPQDTVVLPEKTPPAPAIPADSVGSGAAQAVDLTPDTVSPAAPVPATPPADTVVVEPQPATDSPVVPVTPGADTVAPQPVAGSGDTPPAEAVEPDMAEQDDLAAKAKEFYEQGLRFEKGDGVKQDLFKTVEYYKKALDSGYDAAKERLKACYMRNDVKFEDELQQVNWYEEAGNYGNADALFKMGNLYDTGQGFYEQNHREAAGYYKRAAEFSGQTEAQFRLAEMYQKGEGVAQKISEAVKYYEKAAQQGHMQAQIELAKIYRDRDGNFYQPRKAVYYLKKAVTKNNPEAQYLLGLCYEFGAGIAQSSSSAFEYYDLAAKQNHPAAQYRLARCYREQKNYTEAIKLLRKSANQDYAPAQYLLGYSLEFGEGAETNEYEADKWYRKAANQGNKDAAKAIKRRRFR